MYRYRKMEAAMTGSATTADTATRSFHRTPNSGAIAAGRIVIGWMVHFHRNSGSHQ
jgi:hypothetical protein